MANSLIGGNTMFTFAKIAKKPRLLHRLTGFTLTEFYALLDKFQSGWHLFIQDEFLNKERKRAFGGGRHTRLLSLEDKLFFGILFFHGVILNEVKDPVF